MVSFYYRWGENRFPNILTPETPQVDCLCLDVNSLCEEVFSQLFGDFSKPQLLQQLAKGKLENLRANLVISVQKKIDELLNFYQPSQSLFLAFDGVATVQEMQIWKQRNHLYLQQRPDNALIEKHILLPGTTFMKELEDSLRLYLEGVPDYFPAQVIASFQTVPGSALTKILNRINSNTDHRYLVYSSVESRWENLFFGSILSSSDVYLAPNSAAAELSVSILRQELFQEAGQAESAPDDFVIISQLVSGYFLPLSPSLERDEDSLTLLYDIYLDYGQVLIAQDQGIRYISLNVLAGYLALIQQEEGVRLSGRSIKKYTYPFALLEQYKKPQGFLFRDFRIAWYKRALEPRVDDKMKSRLTSLLNPAPAFAPATLPRIQDMAAEYLVTLNWIYLFLRSGPSKVNREWYYHYHHAPFFVHLTVVSQSSDSVYLYGFRNVVPQRTVSLEQQLVSIIPSKVATAPGNILTDKQQSLFGLTSPVLDLYPARFLFDVDGRNDLSSAAVIVPFIDLTRLQTALPIPTLLYTSELEADRESKKPLIINKQPTRQIQRRK